MVAGSVQELADIIGRYLRDAGGSPQASVVGWGYQTNPPAAAFANGVFGHCPGLRDPGGFRPPTAPHPVLPAALALAEHHHAPGERVITAYVLGWEIQGAVAGRFSAGHRSRLSSAGPGGVPLGGARRQQPRPWAWTPGKP